MELELANFNQAKALSELGFPQENEYEWELGYNKNGRVCPYGIENYGGTIDCYAPTLELVAKWLRSEKNILVLPYLIGFVGIANESTPPELKTNIFGCQIVYYDIYKEGNEFLTLEEFVTYEEALSAGIDKALGILKRNNGNGRTEEKD